MHDAPQRGAWPLRPQDATGAACRTDLPFSPSKALPSPRSDSKQSGGMTEETLNLVRGILFVVILFVGDEAKVYVVR